MITKPTPRQVADAENVLNEVLRKNGRYPGYRDVRKAVSRSFDALDMIDRAEYLGQHPSELTDAQIVMHLATRGDDASTIIRAAVRVLKHNWKV